MHVLLTGATGFVGRNIVVALLQQGWRVTALVRDQRRAQRQLPGASGCIDWRALQEVSAVDAVINLAGAPIVGRRWTSHRRRVLLDSRVGVTERLVEHFLQRVPSPRVFISASAVGYYGNRGATPLTEASGSGAGFLASLCERWEAAAFGAVAMGSRVVVLRLGIVLGTGGGALAKMVPLFRLGLGGQLGSGRQYMPWIHLDDVVGLVLRALEDDSLAGAVNAVAPNPNTNQEFTTALAAALSRRAVVALPAFVLRAALGHAAEALLASQRVLPARLEEIGYAYRFRDLGAAVRQALDH